VSTIWNWAVTQAALFFRLQISVHGREPLLAALKIIADEWLLFHHKAEVKF
jgi:hypothetical protein